MARRQTQNADQESTEKRPGEGGLPASIEAGEQSSAAATAITKEVQGKAEQALYTGPNYRQLTSDLGTEHSETIEAVKNSKLGWFKKLLTKTRVDNLFAGSLKDHAKHVRKNNKNVRSNATRNQTINAARVATELEEQRAKIRKAKARGWGNRLVELSGATAESAGRIYEKISSAIGRGLTGFFGGLVGGWQVQRARTRKKLMKIEQDNN